MMPPTAIITLSTLTSRLIPQKHQKISVTLWAAHTGITAKLVVLRLWVEVGVSDDWVQCLLLDG